MDAKELRIGNYVNFDFHKDSGGRRVIKVYPKDMVANYRDNDAQMYSPIPLTEDWLVEFGFEIGWIISHKERFFNLFKDDDKYYYSSDQGHWTSEAFKHVHQLQNLYYALTQSELKVK